MFILENESTPPLTDSIIIDQLDKPQFYHAAGIPGFFILPGGKLYQWGGSLETSTLIATLESRYHQNPSLLVKAQIPDAPEVSVSINGSTLTITPPVDFVGLFEVTVSVSDGHRSDSRTFLVDVNDSKSSSTTFRDTVFSNFDIIDL